MKKNGLQALLFIGVLFGICLLSILPSLLLKNTPYEFSETTQFVWFIAVISLLSAFSGMLSLCGTVRKVYDKFHQTSDEYIPIDSKTDGRLALISYAIGYILSIPVLYGVFTRHYGIPLVILLLVLFFYFRDGNYPYS